LNFGDVATDDLLVVDVKRAQPIPNRLSTARRPPEQKREWRKFKRRESTKIDTISQCKKSAETGTFEN